MDGWMDGWMDGCCGHGMVLGGDVAFDSGAVPLAVFCGWWRRGFQRRLPMVTGHNSLWRRGSVPTPGGGAQLLTATSLAPGDGAAPGGVTASGVTRLSSF